MNDLTIYSEDGTPLRVHIAPAPEGWAPSYECGCSLDDGFCDEHRAAMRVIHAVWRYGSPLARALIWRLADGYGNETASLPQDWSGVRDSTPWAINRMAEALEGL